jgi:hypothetical protein
LDEEDSLPGGFAAIEVEMDEATEEYADYLNEAENQQLQLVRLKDFKNRILGYIAGYVCLKLSPRIQCSRCKKALENSVDDPLDPKLAQLINQKNRFKPLAESSSIEVAAKSSPAISNATTFPRNFTIPAAAAGDSTIIASAIVTAPKQAPIKPGPQKSKSLEPKREPGLATPSATVFEIISKSEAVFKIDVATKKVLPQQSKLIDLLVPKVIRLLAMEKLFPTLRSHTLEQHSLSEDPHNIALIKLVATRFLEVRCKSHCRFVNQSFSATMKTKNRNLKLSHYKNE